MTTEQQQAFDALYSNPTVAIWYGVIFPFNDFTDTKTQWVTSHVVASTWTNDAQKIIGDCSISMTQQAAAYGQNWISNNVTA